MISYLLLHLQLSLISFIILFFCSLFKSASNKLHLIVLYTFLFKAVFPWGIFNIPSGFLLRKKISGGFSVDSFSEKAPQAGHFLAGLPETDKLLVILWILISAILILIMINGLIKINLISRKAVPVKGSKIDLVCRELINSNNKIQVKITEDTGSAYVWWNGKWSIIIPKRVLEMEYSVQKTIIAHELSHVFRKDLIKHIVLGIMKSIFFFSPFIWFAVSEIIAREEIETDRLAMNNYDLTPLSFGESILKFISETAAFKYTVPSLSGLTKRRLRMRLEYLFQYKNPSLKKRSFFLIVFIVILISFINCTSNSNVKIISNGFCRPVNGGNITMDYGKRIHPIKQEEFFHKGIDIAEELGSPVYAATEGYIYSIGFDSRLGNYILISHKDNLETFYSHLADIIVEEGSSVKKGEKIALVGNTGLSTGPHLHFEIHKNGEAINPHTVMDIK